MKNNLSKYQLEIQTLLRSESKNNRVNWPSEIEVEVSSPNTIMLTLGMASVVRNMQTDGAAFEGWCLLVKHYTGYGKVVLNLSDDQPVGKRDDEAELHFNRFLFRVYWFDRLFGGENGWFQISKAVSDKLNEKEGAWDNGVSNMELSSLSRKKEIVYKGNFLEPFVESYMTFNKTCLEKIQLLLGERFERFERQLPVGLFKDSGPVFSGKGARIDLWGRSKVGLHIFELKSGSRNKKVGIISELFFYTVYMYNLVIKRCFDFSNGKLAEEFSEIKTICSYLLIEKQHPLVNKAVIDLLNGGFAQQNLPIKFGEISYKTTGSKEAIRDRDEKKFKILDIRREY